MPADLAVLGLGPLGLPAAQAATAAAVPTVGFTPDPREAAALAAGRPPADGCLAAAELRRMLARGFTATSEPAELARVRTALVCSPVEQAARALAPRLRPRTLVVLEAAGAPGTTRDVLRPLLEAGSGLTAGRDFHLACAPRPAGPLSRAPRVIGGLTPACVEAAAAFYGRLTAKVVRARGLAEAEAALALTVNARHVTTALVNEMAALCHDRGIDLWDVLRCVEAGPWALGEGPSGPSVPRPGPGAAADADAAPGTPTDAEPGPVNPGGRLRLVGLATEINDRMPRYVTRRAAQLLNEHGKSARGARVLLLGVTTRPDLPGPASAAAREVAERLAALGAELSFHDPHVPAWRVAGRPVSRAGTPHEAAAAADLTLLLQPHSVYDLQGLAAKAQLLLDTRGATPAGAAHRL
ncbi:UDP binding domain-containing protein [Streptomyces sp. 4N509B]|uniref:UDP binding domain-containing protein n=1 Tax=Streptomyces sp. 4N509B TaxID=3457413 RepID=UPI003FD66266